MSLWLLCAGYTAYILLENTGFLSPGSVLSSIVLTYESCPFYEEMRGLIDLGVEFTCRHLLATAGICEQCLLNEM